ncbi:MAG TPA: hypothetical protein DCQ51_03475 [Planktothrix sp. UBA8407]|jgi:hypothetical protein|nr:hypothetical protein [Planktothrix sp. UBA8402]HAO10248.1 hypothetical protein [Planktothrix sp. UBA8407]HBK25116.1 hypothetical protein [Planktothrix sp. UBA10369]
MEFSKLLKRITVYILCAFMFVFCAVAIAIVAIAIKVLVLKLAHQLIYPIFMFGDLLRGLEIIDLLNILVFAIVGMGLGLATGLLPTQDARKISTVFLIILIPIILAVPQIVKYNLWVGDIANDDKLAVPQAKTVADSFLKRRINQDGVFGFYLYTGQFPMVPTRQVQMQELERLEKQINSKFVRVSGIPPTLITIIMGICFWGIRIFYFSIAVITAIAHYREGLRIVAK